MQRKSIWLAAAGVISKLLSDDTEGRAEFLADLDTERPREGVDLRRLSMTTDAARVLGHLDPDYFLGGAMKLDRPAAAAARHLVEELQGEPATGEPPEEQQVVVPGEAGQHRHQRRGERQGHGPRRRAGDRPQ